MRRGQARGQACVGRGQARGQACWEGVRIGDRLVGTMSGYRDRLVWDTVRLGDQGAARLSVLQKAPDRSPHCI